MNLRSRPAGRGLSPGAELASLAVITGAVLAGLVFTGVAITPAAQRPSPGSPQARRVPAAGGPARPAPIRTPGQHAGVALLNRAALASRLVAYSGVAALDWRGAGAPGTPVVVEVWHARGGQALVWTVLAGPDWLGGERRAAEAAGDGAPGPDADGLLGMSQRLVRLLEENYRLAAAGSGWVAGRPAVVVTARRRDGSIAARFWLDRATRLPLRRQMFGPSGTMIGEVAFTRLTTRRAPQPSPPGGVARPWGVVLPAAQVAALRARGWPLPGPLPGGLTLLGAREGPTPAGLAVDLEYSDGLAVFSIFVQRGHLAPGLSGWSRAAVGGQRVYADGSPEGCVAWSVRGFVITVIAAAPEQTVGRVVAALPHDTQPGLFARLGRGMRQLLSWMSP